MCWLRRRGWATPEADPSFDIDGIDAAHKLAILAALAFGRAVRFEDVHVEGIANVTALDIAFARELGYRIKLLGIARRTQVGIEARVHPCLLPERSPLARVDGVYNAVVAEGDFVGRVMLEGRGAGAGPTASAVVADLVDIARGRFAPVWGAESAHLSAAAAVPMADHVGAYFLRLMVRDQPGRDRRCGGGLARLGGFAGKHAAAWARARRGGADRAGDARHARNAHARCHRQD